MYLQEGEPLCHAFLLSAGPCPPTSLPTVTSLLPPGSDRGGSRRATLYLLSPSHRRQSKPPPNTDLMPPLASARSPYGGPRRAPTTRTDSPATTTAFIPVSHSPSLCGERPCPSLSLAAGPNPLFLFWPIPPALTHSAVSFLSHPRCFPHSSPSSPPSPLLLSSSSAFSCQPSWTYPCGHS